MAGIVLIFLAVLGLLGLMQWQISELNKQCMTLLHIINVDRAEYLERTKAVAKGESNNMAQSIQNQIADAKKRPGEHVLEWDCTGNRHSPDCWCISELLERTKAGAEKA